MGFVDLLFWAIFTGVVFLGIFKFSTIGYKKTDFSKKALLSSAVMGIFNPFLYYLVLIKAYSLLDTQEALTLNYVWPIFLVLFSMIFLGQKIKFFAVASMFISFAGIVIIITKGDFSELHFSNGFGIVLALSSAVFWAAYWVLNMKDRRDGISKIWLNLVFGLIYTLLYFLFTAKPLIVPPIDGLLGSLYIGIFEMSLTFVIWMRALDFSEDTAKVSNIIFLAPFVALFWISNTVGETIRLSTLTGLVFCAIIIFVVIHFGTF